MQIIHISDHLFLPDDNFPQILPMCEFGQAGIILPHLLIEGHLPERVHLHRRAVQGSDLQQGRCDLLLRQRGRRKAHGRLRLCGG